MRVAFIGDSFSAYEQTGQQQNSWTWLLARHFPQHQYYNYSCGGRGYDHYQLALLDAKINNIDVVLTNRTFNGRALLHIGDGNFKWEEDYTEHFNYINKFHQKHYWASAHNPEEVNVPSGVGADEYNAQWPESVLKSFSATLREKCVSTEVQTYNQLWYENMDKFYNFKHILKFDLMHDPNDRGEDKQIGAFYELQDAFGINHKQQYQIYQARHGNKPVATQIKQDFMKPLLQEAGLTISLDDDHWSPKANKWVFENYILPKVVDILS